MKHDYQSYRRATSVSLLGLALQLLMGLTMLIYSFVTTPMDAVALTGAVFILLGSMVWLLLAIVFDQHRRERIEQMELEALSATGARESSAFTEGADDLRVAHKRLVTVHKYLVPTASLIYALLLGAWGAWTFLKGRDFLKADAFHSTTNFGVVISISLGVAFVGFIFARYVAGMAKQPVWAHLRAGAGVAVGAAIFALSVAITQLIDKLGPSEPVQYLHVIWPAIIVVLAVEVVLSFLMGMYSPRKPGEFPRPALDSKILSFAAAPDRIAASIGEALNYQFGFDVTGNWFYQLITRSAVGLVLVGVVIVWLLSCIAIVQPNEQGLRVRMGRKLSDGLQPGAYLKLPWPFEHIETYPATIARRLNLGGDEPKITGNKSILWTNDHGVTESFFVVRPAEDDLKLKAAGEDDTTHGGGFALASLEIPVYFAVADYAKFNALAAPVPTDDGRSDLREEYLRSLGRKEAFTLLATKTIDEVLGNGREEISKTLRQRIEKVFADKDTGVHVLFVGIEGVHPPREAAAAFEDIVRAHQRKAGTRESASKDANASLITVAGSVPLANQIVAAIDDLQAATAKSGASAPDALKKQQAIEDLLAKAGGSASKSIQEARAWRWARHMGARAQAEAYIGQIAGYKAAPDVYIARNYFDTLAEALKDARIYIVADDGHTHMNINLEDQNTSGTLLLKKKDE